MRDIYDIRDDEDSFTDTNGEKRPRRGRLENIFIIEYCGPPRKRAADDKKAA